MDNSMTTWIIVALLVLLIGAAIFMLLRRPGGDDALDGREETMAGRDGTGQRDPAGRTTPPTSQGAQAVAADGGRDEPFDQSSYDSAPGATPVDRDQDPRVDGHLITDAEPLGTGTDHDATPGDRHEDPRVDGHLISEDPALADAPTESTVDTDAPTERAVDTDAPTESTVHTDTDTDTTTGSTADTFSAPAEPVNQPVIVDPVDEHGAQHSDQHEGVESTQVDEPISDTGSPAGEAIFAESVYGAGSAEPAPDGSGPQGWEIKGNTGSMLFHTADSPSYQEVRAEVWFEDEDAARNAGFAHWDRRRR